MPPVARPSIPEHRTTSAARIPLQKARAKIFVPPERPRSDRRHKGKPDRANEGRTTLLDDPTPTLQRDTVFCTRKAAERYRRIADDGGWAMIPKALGRDASANDVERLRQRLSIEGNLPQDDGSGDGWDEALTDAVTRFQRRAGLQQSGEVDQATLNELNVPADVRARELEASAKRIGDVKIDFDQRYVVVNIPSASVEAVQDLRVAQRHAAVVGELDHQSPQLIAAIRSITINPAWTIPRSIVETEVIPKLKKNPHYLRRAKLGVLDRKGHKINARRIHWSDAAARQQKSLGHTAYRHAKPPSGLYARYALEADVRSGLSLPLAWMRASRRYLRSGYLAADRQLERPLGS